MSETATKSILLVEDNPDDVDLTLRAMKKNNIRNELVVARDGETALRYLFEAGLAEDDLPEVILLDLNLPRISGLDVLRRVRGDPRTCHLPVVILTSSTEGQDLLRSYELGANSYVRKPVDFARFVEAIRELGLYWLVLNLTPRSARRGE